ncbi:MAG: hypothetical protein AB7S38_28755 [Vulcanimicrobiota bacterium]
MIYEVTENHPSNHDECATLVDRMEDLVWCPPRTRRIASVFLVTGGCVASYEASHQPFKRLSLVPLFPTPEAARAALVGHLKAKGFLLS